MDDAAAPKKKLSGKLIASVIGGIATALSLVLGFISILPLLTQNASGLDKLDVVVEPYRASEVTVFAVPLSQDFTDYPVSSSLTCSDDQQEWLEANGTAFTSYYLITLTNRATTGNVISFSDLLSSGTEANVDGDSVMIECDEAGADQPRIAPARLVLSSEQTAFYDRSRLDASASPDTPVVYNLEPGESGQLVLQLVSRSNFSGVIVHTITSGPDSSVAELSLPQGLVVPGVGSGPLTVFTTQDPLWECAKGSSVDSCIGER